MQRHEHKPYYQCPKLFFVICKQEFQFDFNQWNKESPAFLEQASACLDITTQTLRKKKKQGLGFY
jgi:hypothetical protein